MNFTKMFMASYKGAPLVCHLSYDKIKTLIANESLTSDKDLLDFSISEVFVATKENMIASGLFDVKQILEVKFDRDS